MRAAIFSGPKDLLIKNFNIPKPGEHEILLEVDRCGLCGTDFHIFSGHAPSKPPMIPGHEYVGIVRETGTSVKSLKPGDHVAVDPNIYCGHCQYCRTGKIQFCENLKALGVTLNGGFAENSLLPESQAYKIPDDFSFAAAAFAEPLSCCVHGMDQAGVKHGESVAIVGGGTIGLLMLQLVKISGAGKIIVIEPVERKRNTALTLGADYVFDPDSKTTRDEITELTSGGPDVVIECVGNSSAAGLAFSIPKKGGRVVIFGLSKADDILKINLQKLFHKELTVKSSLLNPFTFSRAVELLVTGKVETGHFNPVISNLEGINKILTEPRDFSVIKYQITPN